MTEDRPRAVGPGCAGACLRREQPGANGLNKNNSEKSHAKKAGIEFRIRHVRRVYDDGTQRSNRKVPRALTGGIDGDKPAHEFLIEQDRDIAEKSGRPPLKIKSIARAGAKKKERDYSERRAG